MSKHNLKNFKDIANAFNKFITPIETKLAENQFENNDSITNEKCKYATVNTEYSKNKLLSLCTAEDTRMDKTSARLLKLKVPVVSSSVTYLMDISLHTVEVPI